MFQEYRAASRIIGREKGNFLFRPARKAYEKSSLVITTNKDFSGWAEIFGGTVQVSAILDRLLHQCLLFSIKGDSHRVTASTDGRAQGREGWAK